MQKKILIKKILPAVALLLSLSGQAQQDSSTAISDSLLWKATSLQATQAYQFFNTDPALLQQSSITRYNQIGLAYEKESGAFRLSQAPEGRQSYQFHTFGTRTAGKFLLSGSFSYTYATIDSLGNTLSYSPDLPFLPAYYFYAIKKGNWTYGGYSLQAIASTGFLHNKLQVSLGLDYQNSSADRSNDPRPSKNTFGVKATPVVAWQVNSRHRLHAGLLLGFDKDRLEVGYKNKAYPLSDLYPEYNSHLIMGYGFIRRWSTNLAIRDYANHLGATGGYSGQWGSSQLVVSGFWKQNDHTYFRPSSGITDGKVEYGTQTDDTRGGKLWWSLDKAAWQYRLQGRYQSIQTSNYSYLLAGSNYGATYDEADLEPMLAQRRKGRLRNEFGLQAQYRYLNRKDGNAGITTTNEWLQLGALHTHYFYWRTTNSLRVQWQAAYRFSLQDKIVVPDLQKTIFSDNVVYPDYNYYRTAAYVLRAQLRYGLRTKAGLVTVQAGMLYNRAAQVTTANGIVYPQASRTLTNMGVFYSF